MSLPPHLIVRVAACLSMACLLVGCHSSDRRAQAALTDYQAAAASNDVVGARQALLRLVRAKDDVADYWAQLGTLEATTGRYGEAYYAFTRAYELDRRNPELVRAVTQLALRGGDIALAERHAQELEVLVPGDPWVKLTRGWAAIAQSRFDQALVASDAILATSPFDPSATVLKARALMGLGRAESARDLLERQIQAQPSDNGSLKFLQQIYIKDRDWPKVARVAQQLRSLTPGDQENALLLVQAAFRANNVPLARRASYQLLQPNGRPTLIASVLDIWTTFWPSSQRIEDASRLAARVDGPEQKLVYAGFLTRWGSPAEAARLAAPAAGIPITAENAEANAVLANAWSRAGNIAPAKSRFDAVLAYDPGNATALRGRAELALRTGNASRAVLDAQKLVTVLPSSAADRLLLARCFAAAGNRPWVERTLWAAFQDIPANDEIYAALIATKKGNIEAIRELQEEFARQRDANVGRGLL
jgi:predicted Zn-dependent protease